MLLKIVVTLAVFATIWLVLFRANRVPAPRRDRGKKQGRKSVQAEDLVRCSRCGAYRAAERACVCQNDG